MLAAVRQCCLNLVPMLAWDYSWYSHLLVHQSVGVVIPSQSGVRQGDPLGPLVFTVTLQGPLELITEMQLARPLNFADNTFVQGSQVSHSEDVPGQPLQANPSQEWASLWPVGPPN
jgi:hypothetical protein